MAVRKTVTGTDFETDTYAVSPKWVVISFFNTLLTMLFAAAGMALGSGVMIIVSMVVGGAGSIPVDLLDKVIPRRHRRRSSDRRE